MARSLPVRLVPAPGCVEDGTPLYGSQSSYAPQVHGSLALKPYPCERPGRAAPLRLATEHLETAADRLILLSAEVLAGRCALQQLARQATAELAQILYEQRNLPVPTRVGPPRIRSRRIQQPTDGIAEVSATVLTSGRAQALALRLVLHRGRWRCAALESAVPC
ncbi:MAG: Rv3235 family protein [Streptosporangiaceae bacterium]